MKRALALILTAAVSAMLAATGVSCSSSVSAGVDCMTFKVNGETTSTCSPCDVDAYVVDRDGWLICYEGQWHYTTVDPGAQNGSCPLGPDGGIWSDAEDDSSPTDGGSSDAHGPEAGADGAAPDT